MKWGFAGPEEWGTGGLTLTFSYLKLVIQKCVFAINVDPDGHYADVFVRTIPAVTPEIERALNSEESKALVATAACARNRT